MGYNQTPNTSTSYASPVVSQPSNSMPPTTSMYNTSPQPPFNQQGMPPPPSQQQSPYQQQYPGALPEGPVGGVSGYDPQLHAKMAGMSVHTSFSKLWVIILSKYLLTFITLLFYFKKKKIF